MAVLWIIAAFAVFVAAVALVIYLVREAAVLKVTAERLQDELTHFKQGGFNALIQQELKLLTGQATQEVRTREQLLEESRARLEDQQRNATAATKQFQTDLGALKEQVDQLKDLHGKVGELNDLLKPQQLRGELGEVIVRTLIADKLPLGHYEEDYAFADGKRVEFVIRLQERLIPVDSKLQLDSYKRMRDAEERQRQTARTEFKRAIRQKIDEVKLYIRPEEGTFNFALMVIPSEAVYYDIIGNKDFVEEGGLYDYARSQNVFLVSPVTFWAYLTAIAQGLQGLEIERRAGDILASLQTISTQIQHFSLEEFRLIGDHLKNARAKYDEASEKLDDIREGLTTLKRLSPQHAPEHDEVAA